MMNTTLRTTLLGVSLAATGALVAPAIAGAQVDEGSVDEDSVETEDVTATEADGSARWDEFLAPLVEDGTLTQSQADSITDSLGDRARNGFGRGNGAGMGHGLDSEVLTDLLGLTQDELTEQLRAGSSLAEVAEANGIDTQAVIDALVAEKQAQLDQRVADGDITAEHAAEHAAELDERVTARVNGEFEGRGRHGFGPRGGGAADIAEEAATEAAA